MKAKRRYCIDSHLVNLLLILLIADYLYDTGLAELILDLLLKIFN